MAPGRDGQAPRPAPRRSSHAGLETDALATPPTGDSRLSAAVVAGYPVEVGRQLEGAALGASVPGRGEMVQPAYPIAVGATNGRVGRSTARAMRAAFSA